MSTKQFCPACSTDMPKYRATGQWVEVEGHEHELPAVRPQVYLSDSTPGAYRWTAHLPIWDGNGWMGAREFSSMEEAMEYAANMLALPVDQ